jgi:hypothetical protein
VLKLLALNFDDTPQGLLDSIQHGAEVISFQDVLAECLQLLQEFVQTASVFARSIMEPAAQHLTHRSRHISGFEKVGEKLSQGVISRNGASMGFIPA